VSDRVVGLLVGLENTFPAPFLSEVNERGRAAGVRAEMATLGGSREQETPQYAVIVDRISHEVPYYRAFLKSAVVMGTTVINDPFWWEADEKFVECTLARELGVAVPRTVVLPNHSYIEGIDPQRSLRNLRYPLPWDELVEYTGLPAVLKPNTGGGWKDVHIVRSRDELIAAYDTSGTKTMILQEFIDWEDYTRCICIGGEVHVMRYDPRLEFAQRYVVADPPGRELRERSEALASKLVSALGYDMDTVEFAVRDGELYAIDFLNPAPDFDSFSIKEDAFRWVIDRMAQLVIAYATGERRSPWAGKHRFWEHIGSGAAVEDPANVAPR
jgi:glutathione synthase/RimK-type ligase-like ATP-grasp enzyme